MKFQFEIGPKLPNDRFAEVLIRSRANADMLFDPGTFQTQPQKAIRALTGVVCTSLFGLSSALGFSCAWQTGKNRPSKRSETACIGLSFIFSSTLMRFLLDHSLTLFARAIRCLRFPAFERSNLDVANLQRVHSYQCILLLWAPREESGSEVSVLV